jgi:hypothetical protein
MQNWRRANRDVFPYGYFYAQMLSFLFIIIVYSTSIPLIFLAGALNFVLRHIVDSFNLLTWNKHEVESSGGVINKVLVYAIGSCLMFQGLLGLSFFFNRMYFAAFFTVVIFFLTIYIMDKVSQDLIQADQIELPGQSMKDNPVTQQFLASWRKLYDHPLASELEK